MVNKLTGVRQKFKRYHDSKLAFLQAKTPDGRRLILDFNLSKLEIEYDYETDEEQLISAKEMLVQENISAIEFCVKEDPLLLVGNLNEDY